MSKRILLDDPEVSWDDAMQFRLTYDGPLNASQRDARDGERSKHAENKHAMRMNFHSQLERLWAESNALNGQGGVGFTTLREGHLNAGVHRISADKVAEAHQYYGFEFVPLITSALDLACDIDILMLRPERPGNVLWAGDIDNRLKTLLDALRIPESAEHYHERKGQITSRIFCLLVLQLRFDLNSDSLLLIVGGGLDHGRCGLGGDAG